MVGRRLVGLGGMHRRVVRVRIVEWLGLGFLDGHRVRCAMGLDWQAIHVLVLLWAIVD
jgi:hypothetical protein